MEFNSLLNVKLLPCKVLTFLTQGSFKKVSISTKKVE